MARKKDAPIVLYRNWLATFTAMSNDQVGKIMKAVAAHVLTGEPATVWPELQTLTDQIVESIDENLTHYEDKCARNKQIAAEREAKKAQEKNGRNTDVTRTCNERATNVTRTCGNTNTKTNTNTNINSLSNDKEKEGTTSNKSKSSTVRFVPPSVEDVRRYCQERNNRVDADAFVSFYESNGWRVGKNPMKDWKAAVRTWEKRTNELHANALNTVQPKKSDDFVDLDAMRKDPKYAFIFANERRVD